MAAVSAIAGIGLSPAQIFNENAVIMPPAQQWNFVRYGNAPVNHYTGTVGVEIPLYLYRDKDFELPISLSYVSDGYKPNMPSGSVGLGWHLNIGGSITVQVRGINDFTSATRLSNNMGTVKGMYHFMKLHENGPVNYEIPGILFDPLAIYRLRESPGTSFETEPDIYSFRFLDHSGKFIMTPNGVYFFDTSHPQGTYKLDVELSGSTSPRFTITTGDGYKYIFSEANPGRLVWMSVANYSYQSVSEMPIDYHLVSIVAHNGRTVTLNYGAPEESEIVTIGGSCKIQSGQSTGVDVITGEYKATSFSGYIDYSRHKNEVCQLESIRIDNGVEIILSYGNRTKEKGRVYDSNTTAYIDLQTPRKLDGIKVINGAITLAAIDLSYIYTNSASPVMFLKEVSVSGTGKYMMEYHEIVENQTVMYPKGAATDLWGYGRDGFKRDVLPDATIQFDYKENKSLTASSKITGMLSKITYPTGGFTTYEYEGHYASQYIERDITNSGYPYLLSKNIPVGGVRIKAITDYSDPADLTQLYRREYSYVDEQGVSTGILLHIPRLYYDYIERMIEIYTNPFRRVIQMSLGGLGLPPYDKNHIEYKKVREKFPDGSYIDYAYYNYEDFPDIYSISTGYTTWLRERWQDSEMWELCQVTVPANYENLHREGHSRANQRGKLKTKEIYNASGQLIQKDSLYYYTYNGKADYYSHLSIGRYDGYYVDLNIYDIPCTEIVTTNYYDNGAVTTETSYQHNTRRQIDKVTTTSTGHPTYITKIEYPNTWSGTVAAKMVENNFLDFPTYMYSAIKRDNSELYTSAENYEYGFTGNVLHVNSINRAFVDLPVLSQQELLNHMETDILYEYDDKGNVITTIGRDGIRTAYLWGYDRLYIVARIENAPGWDVIRSNTGITSTYVSAGLSESQIAALQELSGSKVSVYEYQPFVGPLKVIEPSGRMLTYQYNSDWKLERVIDQDGNSIQEYEYNIITNN